MFMKYKEQKSEEKNRIKGSVFSNLIFVSKIIKYNIKGYGW